MKQILQIGLGAWVCALFSSCVAPPHLPKPHVTVGYTQPRVSPDGTTAYFIKTVSQESTTMQENVNVLAVSWAEKSYPVWSRFFLCRSDSSGKNPILIFELPWRQFVIPGNVNYGSPTVWWPFITQFDVSWAHRKAVVFVNRPQENTHFIDLNTGKIETFSIGDPTRGGHGTYNPYPLQLIEDGSLVLWSDALVGTFDFEGNAKTTNMLVSTGQLGYYSTPLWNQEPRVIVFKCSSFSGTSNEWRVFNSRLEQIDAVDQQTITALNKTWMEDRRAGRKTDHKYAWVMDRSWSGNRHSEASSGFALKNHVIESRRIEPKDAATVW